MAHKLIQRPSGINKPTSKPIYDRKKINNVIHACVMLISSLSHFTTDNHGQKQLRHSPNKTCFVERMFFQSPISHFDPLSPFQCCNHGTVSTERISTLKKGRGGFGYQQKRCFLKLQKDTDRECLFCSNVSTLLSMIGA